MTSEDSVCSCSTRLAMDERSLDREHISSTIPIIDRKFLGIILANSLNVRHIFRNPVVRLLDTLLWKGCCMWIFTFNSRSACAWTGGEGTSGPGFSGLRIDPDRSECSELPEQSPEVVDGLAGSCALGGRLPPSVRRAVDDINRYPKLTPFRHPKVIPGEEWFLERVRARGTFWGEVVRSRLREQSPADQSTLCF